jgi:hypothetical protein
MQKPTQAQREAAFVAAKEEVQRMKMNHVGHWSEVSIHDDEIHRIADAVADAVVACHQ